MADVREPTVIVRGDVSGSTVAYARAKLLAVVDRATNPVLAATVRLDHYSDPGRQRANHVEMTLDLDGTPIRASRSAPTMPEAIDRAEDRLRRRVEAANELPQTHQLRHRDEQSWHHDDRRMQRPAYFPRLPADRSIVRRKSFAARPESIEEALFDLESLDHDFFLFVHDETDAEAVVYRIADGYGLMQRVATPEAVKAVEIPLDLGPDPGTITLAAAVEILDGTDLPFEFFVERGTGRGTVLYRRYDGNYGLIVAG